MVDTLRLLDEAIEAGKNELGRLAAGEVDEAARLAARRGRVTTQALETKEPVSLDLLLVKLDQLKSLQGRLTQEARKLHESLKQDLIRVKREGKRFGGYGNAAKVTPIMRYKYIDKQS